MGLLLFFKRKLLCVIGCSLAFIKRYQISVIRFIALRISRTIEQLKSLVLEHRATSFTVLYPTQKCGFIFSLYFTCKTKFYIKDKRKHYFKQNFTYFTCKNKTTTNYSIFDASQWNIFDVVKCYLFLKCFIKQIEL